MSTRSQSFMWRTYWAKKCEHFQHRLVDHLRVGRLHEPSFLARLYRAGCSSDNPHTCVFTMLKFKCKIRKRVRTLAQLLSWIYRQFCFALFFKLSCIVKKQPIRGDVAMKFHAL